MKATDIIRRANYKKKLRKCARCGVKMHRVTKQPLISKFCSNCLLEVIKEGQKILAENKEVFELLGKK